MHGFVICVVRGHEILKRPDERGTSTTLIILAVVIAGLATGLLGSFFYYQGELDSLNSRNKSLSENYISLESDYENLQADYQEVEGFKENYQNLKQSYESLLKTIEATEVENFTQTVEYDIEAGTNKTWTFVLPFGILWDAKIEFSGSYVSLSHSWRKENKRGFVGGTGQSLTPSQSHLEGTITIDYYYEGESELWVNAMISTQLPSVQRGGTEIFQISK